MSVMIGTKVKDAETWLPRFISQVEQLEGDIQKIVVMFSPSQDASFSYLKHWQETSKHLVEIYNDPYLPPSERHGATLARVKQDIQKILKESGAEYYLNLDCDLVSLPKDLIPMLMKEKKDLIAGMTWTEGREIPTFFDTYVYRMDKARFHPFNPPGLNREEPFKVDSVSTCYLARTEVELAGEYLNPYPHIFFCNDLIKKGYEVWVHPKVHAVHIDLEKLGIMHQPLPHELSMSPFIDDKGLKWSPQQVSAQDYHIKRLLYMADQMTKQPNAIAPSLAFLNSRPLITASYKVFNEAEYIEYSLESIYPYVDRIDIAEGGIKLRGGQPSTDNTVELIQKFPDPEHKIRLFRKQWENKEEIQAKLLELCTSKWMLFIDADEVVSGMDDLRRFCEANQNGLLQYARPSRFLNFWHDFGHIAYSLNPASPWSQVGLPHPFLIHRDIPGLNFNTFHTIPTDGFGVPVATDTPYSQIGKTVLDSVNVYHFGSVKSAYNVVSKLEFEKARGINYNIEVKNDAWLTGSMEPDFVIDDYDQRLLPELMRKHPKYGKLNIRVTQTIPNFKFEAIDK